MSKLNEFAKNILLAVVPKYLRGRALHVYVLALSRASNLIGLSQYIQKIERASKGFNSSVKVTCSDGVMYLPSINRTTRFLKGVTNATDRLFSQYVHPDHRSLLRSNESNILLLDVGANVGEFSMHILKVFPKSRVLAFEPDPKTFSCLRANLEERFDKSRLILIPSALSDTESVRDLYISSEEADTSLHIPKQYSSRVLVKTETLFNYVDEIDRQAFVMLKMDAEGNEPEVLRGAGAILKKIDFLCIDVSPERVQQSTLDSVTQILQEEGFDVSYHNDKNGRQFVNATQKERE